MKTDPTWVAVTVECSERLMVEMMVEMTAHEMDVEPVDQWVDESVFW